MFSYVTIIGPDTDQYYATQGFPPVASADSSGPNGGQTYLRQCTSIFILCPGRFPRHSAFCLSIDADPVEINPWIWHIPAKAASSLVAVSVRPVAGAINCIFKRMNTFLRSEKFGKIIQAHWADYA